MQTAESTTTGGLNGRARKAHRRNRVTRLYQDEMVAEYFCNSEENVIPQKQIPIRHKNEFLPSAHYVDQKTLTAYQQLELPLKSKINMNKNKRMSKLIPRHHAIKFTNAQKSKSAIHSSRSRKFKDAKAWQPIHLSPRIFTNRSLWQRRFSSLSLGGFAYGCLLGGAAAAFMLMLVDIMMTRAL